MLRDELALKTALTEELTYEAQPADLAQLQAMWSGEASASQRALCATAGWCHKMRCDTGRKHAVP